MITIKINKSQTRWPRRRPQRYYWVALNSNGKALARSSEMYTNRADCEWSALRTFSLPVVVRDSDGKSLYEIRSARRIDQ